jgi:hypothetical protein
MADSALVVSFLGPFADDVRAAAAACGMSPDEYVRQAVAEELVANSAETLDWDQDLRRLEEPGDNIPAEPAFAEIRARLVARADREK